MKIRPLGDRVLVEPIEEKEQTVGGIIIPDAAKEKPMHKIFCYPKILVLYQGWQKVLNLCF
mgnify:CR=1 FL=1